MSEFQLSLLPPLNLGIAYILKDVKGGPVIDMISAATRPHVYQNSVIDGCPL